MALMPLADPCLGTKSTIAVRWDTLFGISKSKKKCPMIGIDGEGFETAKNHLGFSFAFTSLD
jgi:hypothetical protein